MLLLGLLLPALGGAATLVAERITDDNAATHRVGGPDADGGVGDWFLSNGTLCAVVSAPEHESALTPNGGMLVDLGHCGAKDDQWNALQPLVNFARGDAVPVDTITSGVEQDRAWIRTRAIVRGVALETTYSLERRNAKSLGVETRARRVAVGDALFSIGQVILHTSGQVATFHLDRDTPSASRGFRYPEADYRSPTSLYSAIASSDLTVLVGAQGFPPISYGIETVRATRLTPAEGEGEADTDEAVPTLSVTGKHFSLEALLVDAPWIGEATGAPGLTQLAQIPFMDIEDEAEVVFEQRILVGDRADVASITDRIFGYGALVTGTVDDPAARIHVERESGAPLSLVAPDEDGRFALRLPAGPTRFRVVAPGDREVIVPFDVPEYGRPIEPLALEVGPAARIALPPGFVGRLTFLPAEGGDAIRFGDDLLGHWIGEEAVRSGIDAPWLDLGGGTSDPSRAVVPPGRYRVLASRGPEYASLELELEAKPGETTPLVLTPLERVAPTPGWISADYHVHSGESFDSGVPPIRQMAAFAASGSEILVATEHDRVVDPRATLAASGLADRLRVVGGLEATSEYAGGDSPFSTGHLNAYPVQPITRAPRGGAPPMEGRRLRDLLNDLRARPERPFLQMNHPRPDPLGGEGSTYFAHLGVAGEPFDPAKPLSEMPNRVLIEPSPEHGGTDLDFDGIELMNGAWLSRYRETRADWFSLLLQGERLIGLANSDSHALGEQVGLPRTYVAQEDDRLDAFDEAAHLVTLRAGRAWGTTGPLLTLRLGQAGLGELHAGETGELVIRVDAAPWIPIAEWRAYVNGELVHRAPIAAGESARLPLAFATDAFVTVEVEGPAEGRYAEIHPDYVPFAFTNPIFVDADGNGRFDAPGLPDALPTTITNPADPN